ncbi:GNAT family N-acetyltransferase [Arsenicicoccus piscis]|uniref:GNAT family N-acetyltransferase n=1 Tax=Arsenicicoccus piscis TaxID=673954 RepID=A0ABQ6HS99_9MICO|nr:GNAT family N-acetyltransferase [Arsenicicoccus piscis]MCH8628079.1 GNAT family N-acetyltransferase [Arsenicicoccus piscis]GMA20558.1 hypothetical protein GCM10025862_25790 [Arsenicicoccus piscis]
MARTDDLSDDPSTRLSPGAAGAAGIARAALPATRRAVAADIPDLVELRRLMFEAMGSAGHADPGWQRAAAQWFERALGEPEVYGIFVSVDQGGPDGRERVCASVVGQVRDAPPAPGNPGGGDGLVQSVCTYPWARRQGHARAVFATVIGWFETGTPIRRLELMATVDGRPLYEQWGFEVTAFPAMRLTLPR